MKKIIISILLVLMFINPVSATVWVSNGTIELVQEGKINSTMLESKLDSWLDKNPSFGKVNDYINQTSKNVWIYRQPVKCGDNSTLVFDPADDCKELRLGATINKANDQVKFGTKLSRSPNNCGAIVFRNTCVIGWNESTRRITSSYTDMIKIEAYNLTLENTTFSAIGGIYCYNKINPLTRRVSNITINDSESGIHNYNINDVKFSNIRCNNISLSGFELGNCSGCELYNYNFANDPSFRSVHNNSGHGVIVNGGHNNYIHDLNVDNARWSGIYFYFSQLEHDTIVRNMTVSYAGHNGIDVHGGYNLTLQNITASNSYSNDFLVSGPYRSVPGHEDYGVYNVTLQNISSCTPSFFGITIGNRTSNIYINNVSIKNKPGTLKDGIRVLDCDNVTATGFNSDRQCRISWCLTTYCDKTTKDITLIDASLYNSSYKDVYYNKSSNAKLLNTNYTTLLTDLESDYFNIYYLDIIAKYKNGSISPNTKIIINPNISKYQSQDGYARDKTIFYTNSKGQTYLPNNNRSSSPAIIEYHKNLDGTYDFLSHTIKVVPPNNNTISLSGITPDSSWYRKDPNAPTYTITAIIPDNSKGPQITGFAPSENNPFNIGEKKIFRVWTDKPLVKMRWSVDGSNVSEGSLTYTWTAGSGSHIIEFSGNDANGTVVRQEWKNIGISGKLLNRPPVITSFEPANKSVFNEGQRIKISLNASDADNQTLNFTIKIDGTMCSKSSSCIWNTSYSSSGNHTIEVTASDGIEVVKKINTIYINDYHPRWDVNEDGVVDFLDINIIAQNYGTIPKAPYPDWDVNQDGVINLGDLLLAESHFGEKVV